MTKKTEKAAAQKKQRRVMKKRSKDKERRKVRAGAGAVSENAIQHQMLSEFGSVQNFIKNVVALGELMKTDADLKALRYDPAAVYEQFDLAADRDALADAYANAEHFHIYGEAFQDFWREKRKAVLPAVVTEAFTADVEKTFKKLMVTKRGFKKEYRAVLAGHLLVQSHLAAVTPTDAPLEDNNLWELVLLATIKENPRDLPEPQPATATEPSDSPAADGEPTSEPETK